MGHGVRLQRQLSAISDQDIHTSCRMKILVYDVCGINGNIFVYKTQVVDADSELKKGTFVGVATPDDMSELPIGEPNSDGFYRLDQVDILFRNSDYLNETWLLILSDVGLLMEALTERDNLEPAEDVVIS
jgi:hypothetical protein